MVCYLSLMANAFLPPKNSNAKAASYAAGDFEITGYDGDQQLIERLKELGLSPGLKISLVGRAPFFGPLLFRLGAMVLALREEEAACLNLRPL